MEKQKIKSYRDLIVWQKSREFVVLVYKITGRFPNHELFGLTSQIRRASISIPSNVAEGFRRKTSKDKLNFLRTAYASGSELETQLIISKDLGYTNAKDYANAEARLNEIMSMLNKIIYKFENPTL